MKYCKIARNKVCELYDHMIEKAIDKKQMAAEYFQIYKQSQKSLGKNSYKTI
jgi:hypothetical protein